MRHRSRHAVQRSLAWGLLLAACTKLQDPNDQFGPIASGAGSAGRSALGDAGRGNSGGPSIGASGAGGDAGSAGDSGAVGSCRDVTGFNGLGCYACAPTDILGFENACTSSVCTHFDNVVRLTKLGPDGKLPDLPSSAGGASGTIGASPSAGSGGSGATAGKACSDLAAQGTVVYISGSSAAKPFLQQIAQQVVNQRVYVVYASTGSCAGVDAILNGTPLVTGATAPAASATYWDSSSSTGLACDLPAPGVAVDIGVSDVFAQSCPGFEDANLTSSQVRDAHGPVQTMTFVVPTSSAFAEISAQAAYFVFGFGADGGVRDAVNQTLVWNDESYLFQRSPSSGTQAMLSAAIGVPATVWRGKAHKSSDDVAADIQSAGQQQGTANRAIGILAADYIDSKNLRAQIRVLGFQDSAQTCAVFPDSTSNAHDKRNVRDGHYPVWGPLHLLLKVDESGNPVNASKRQVVTDIVGYLSGSKALPNGVLLLDVYAQSGLIPECAMRVSRTKDGGNIQPFKPENPCSCLFDVKATGTTTCTACKVQGDCKASQTCSQGYCEG